MLNIWYVGIDPGVTGAVAVIDASRGMVVKLRDLPNNSVMKKGKKPRTVANLSGILHEFKEITTAAGQLGCMPHFAMEWVTAQACPKEARGSIYTFGRMNGALEAFLVSMEVPYTMVVPTSWKAAFGLLKKDKAESITKAAQLHPEVRETIGFTNDAHNRAEAVLIAHFLMLKQQKGAA